MLHASMVRHLQCDAAWRPTSQERSTGHGMLTRPHVPYRNSLLTAMLKDSLGGNCATAMLATVSTEASQLEESIATCRFAQRVALITNEVGGRLFSTFCCRDCHVRIRKI